MHASFAKVFSFAVLATQLAPSLALPLAPVAGEGAPAKRSLKAIGTAVAGGIVSGAASAAVKDILSDREVEERSLKAVGTAIAGGIAAGTASSFISNVLNRRDTNLLVDTDTGVIYADVPDAVEGRSLKAIGTALAGGVASGLANAAVSDIFNKREVTEERSLKAVGTAIAGGIAAGSASAAISNLLNREVDSGLLVDTDTGVIYMNVPDAVEGRSLKAIGTALAGGVASGLANVAVGDILNNREVEERSLKAIGTAIAGGIASGAASATISNILNREVAESSSSNVFVDTDSGVIYMDVPDAVEGRSLKAIGTAVAGGIAAGTASATISNLLNREVEERSLKAIGTAIAGGIASGAASATIGNIFNREVAESSPSNVFVDTDSGLIYMDVPDAVEGRSLKAIGTAVAGGIASGAAAATINNILNREVGSSNVLVDTDSGVIYLDTPDSVEGRSLKAIGTALVGGIASGLARTAVNDVLNNRDLPGLGPWVINELD